MATSGLSLSFKQELMQAAHCFNATQTGVSCSGTNGTNLLTGLASIAGLAVGMSVSGTGVAANSVIAGFPSTTSVTVYPALTGTVSSVTFTGDVFKAALIKAGPTRTFDSTQTNIGTPGSGSPTTSNLGTDEIAASGSYTSGGVTLVNVTPSLPGSPSTTATTSFGSFTITGATISTTGMIIYNTNTRLGTAGRVVEILDFGGTQTVTNGSITVQTPVNVGSTALIQIA